MDESKIFPFEGVMSECNMPPDLNKIDQCLYWYFFKKTSNDQFDQIKVSFEVDAIAPSQRVDIYRLIYEKSYSIIEKGLPKEELYPLLYECIVDAYEHFREKMDELVVDYLYLRHGEMKLRDYHEELVGFEIERF